MDKSSIIGESSEVTGRHRRRHRRRCGRRHRHHCSYCVFCWYFSTEPYQTNLRPPHCPILF